MVRKLLEEKWRLRLVIELCKRPQLLQSRDIQEAYESDEDIVAPVSALLQIRNHRADMPELAESASEVIHAIRDDFNSWRAAA